MAISIAFAVNKQVGSPVGDGAGGGPTGSGPTSDKGLCVCCCQTEFGIVYSCVEDKLFHAQRGRGAFLNGEPLHASGQEGDITHTPVTPRPHRYRWDRF